MAEFCFNCYKKYFNKNAERENFIISKYNNLDLCEGCREYKPIIIREKDFSDFCIFLAFGVFILIAKWICLIF